MQTIPTTNNEALERELQEAAHLLAEHAEAEGWTKAELLRQIPALKSDRTFDRIRSGDFASLGDLVRVAEALAHHAAQEAPGNRVVFKNQYLDGHGTPPEAAMLACQGCGFARPGEDQAGSSFRTDT